MQRPAEPVPILMAAADLSQGGVAEGAEPLHCLGIEVSPELPKLYRTASVTDRTAIRGPLPRRQRPRQQVGRATQLAQTQRFVEVDAERLQVLREAGGRARVRPLQVGHQAP